MRFFILVMTVLLFGCNKQDEPAVEGFLTGTAPAGSTVVVSSLSNKAIAQGKANELGRFSIKIEDRAPETFLVKSEAGKVERIAANPIALTTTTGFMGVVNYAAGKENIVHLDYTNTIASAIAEEQIKRGVEMDVAARRAQEDVSEWVGYDISSFSSNYLHGSSSETLLFGNVQAALVMEAIIDLCVSLEVKEELVSGACSLTKIAEMNHKDVVNDGILDAMSITGRENIGSVAIDEWFLRHELAMQLLKTARKHEDSTGVKVLNLQGMSDAINKAGISIFPGVAMPEIPRKKPYLSIKGLDTVARDNYRVGINSFDYLGVKYLTVILNGKQVPLDPLTEVYEFDTKDYNNGPLTIEVIAVNNVGDESMVSGTVNIQNKYEIIKSISTESELVGGKIKLSADIRNDQGIKEVRFVVDSAVVGTAQGEEDDLGLYDQEFDTTKLRDGEHSYLLEVLTGRGNTYSKELNFYVDNTPPELDWGLAEESEDPNEFPSLPVLERIQEIGFEVRDRNPLKSIRLYWNDDLLKTLSPVGVSLAGWNSYSPRLVVDTRTVHEGIHTLVVEVVDSTGNKSSQEREVIVDWSDPLLKFTSPSGMYFAGPKEIKFQASDTNGFGDSEITVKKIAYLPKSPGDESDVIEDIQDLQVNALAKSGSFIITPENGEGGQRRIEMEVMDLSGKKAKASIDVNFANVAPSIKFTRVDNNNSPGKNTSYHIAVTDRFNLDEIESYKLTCTGGYYGVDIISAGKKDNRGVTVFKTNFYKSGYDQCGGVQGGGKSVKSKDFFCGFTATNSLGLTAVFPTTQLKDHKDCR